MYEKPSFYTLLVVCSLQELIYNSKYKNYVTNLFEYYVNPKT